MAFGTDAASGYIVRPLAEWLTERYGAGNGRGSVLAKQVLTAAIAMEYASPSATATGHVKGGLAQTYLRSRRVVADP